MYTLKHIWTIFWLTKFTTSYMCLCLQSLFINFKSPNKSAFRPGIFTMDARSLSRLSLEELHARLEEKGLESPVAWWIIATYKNTTQDVFQQYVDHKRFWSDGWKAERVFFIYRLCVYQVFELKWISEFPAHRWVEPGVGYLIHLNTWWMQKTRWYVGMNDQKNCWMIVAFHLEKISR